MLWTIRNVLSSSLLFWEIAGYASTALVILGCIGEYIAEFTSIPKDKTEEHKWSKLSLIVLIVGIAGELLTAIMSSQISSQAISDLQGKVGRAEQSALSAEGAAGRANTRADAANAAAGTAQLKADGAKQDSDKANAALVEAQKKLSAVAKEANSVDQSLSIVQILSSRYVMHPDKLKADFIPFKGMAIAFRSYMNDGDGYFLCREIVSIAKEAGISATDQCGTWPAYPPFATGIGIAGPNDDTMLLLSKAFVGQTPFGSTAGPFGKVPHSPIWVVFVGMKGRVYVGETDQTRDAARRAAEIKKGTLNVEH